VQEISRVAHHPALRADISRAGVAERSVAMM